MGIVVTHGSTSKYLLFTDACHITLPTENQKRSAWYYYFYYYYYYYYHYYYHYTLSVFQSQGGIFTKDFTPKRKDDF